MAKSISGSVGFGGMNRNADVRLVQELLNGHASKMPGFMRLKEDGISGNKTVTAIKQFQRTVVGFQMPDGRVDPVGKTFTALTAGSGPGGGHQIPKKPKPVAGMITLTVQHGNKIPTKTNGLTATITEMYESTFTLSGALSGTFSGSIYPNDMDVKGRVVDGTYPLHIGFHQGGTAPKQTDLTLKTEKIRPGLLVNCRSSVPVSSNNPSKTTSSGINVHNGFNTKRGSDGCLTLKSSDWSRFMQPILDMYDDINDWHTIGTNSGKKIGSVIIKA